VVALDPEHELAGELVTVQTPQAFRASDLYAAYLHADADGFDGTDTASTIERYTELAVVVVPGPDFNTKITYPTDVSAGEARRT
jgi:2-C-methyl-D-erythritol 4-phosphate cytidylyltransferase